MRLGPIGIRIVDGGTCPLDRTSTFQSLLGGNALTEVWTGTIACTGRSVQSQTQQLLGCSSLSI